MASSGIIATDFFLKVIMRRSNARKHSTNGLNVLLIGACILHKQLGHNPAADEPQGLKDATLNTNRKLSELIESVN